MYAPCVPPWNRRRSRSLVASAADLDTAARAGETGATPYKEWQDEAWAMYDAVGEFRQGVKWLSNVVSRARLVAAQAPQNPGDEPTPIDPDTQDPAVGFVEAIGHGIGGQSELLRSATVHLTVPGEGWFVGAVEGVDDAAELAWKFYSRDEVHNPKPDQTDIKFGENDWRPLPVDALPVRVWRPHDRYHYKADSSTRAALPILRRLELLNRKVDAQIQSRLASNGMYWVPEEMDFPAKEKYEGADDPFVAEVLDLWTTAIRTPGSAAAAVPFIARAKAEWIEKLRYDDFAKLLDPDLRADREFEIRRLATAMDVPPEVLLGMVGMNHWGAWQVEESALKTTVTNLLELICWSLTTGYLWPALGAMGETRALMPLNQDFEDVPSPNSRVIWYDLSELSVRPDRSANTIVLHKDMTVSDEAVLRETGLDATDLLSDPEEIRRRIGLKIVENPQAATLEVGLELLGVTTVAKVTMPDSGAAPPGGNVEAQLPPGALPANDSVPAPPAGPPPVEAPAAPPSANGARVPVGVPS